MLINNTYIYTFRCGLLAIGLYSSTAISVFMQVETYDEQTKKKIVTFLKKKHQAITSEIVRLGGKKRVINWQSLKLILTDLEVDGKIRKLSIGRKLKVYEWIGGD